MQLSTISWEGDLAVRLLGFWHSERHEQDLVDLASHVSLEASDDFSFALSFEGSALHVGLCGLMPPKSNQDNSPQRAICLPISTAIKSVTVCFFLSLPEVDLHRTEKQKPTQNEFSPDCRQQQSEVSRRHLHPRHGALAAGEPPSGSAHPYPD